MSTRRPLGLVALVLVVGLVLARRAEGGHVQHVEPTTLRRVTAAFLPGESWRAWHAVTAALFALPAESPEEAALFRQCTGRSSWPTQLTNWIITQTDRFKASIPRASIANLVSFNYMAYYHDYLAVEFGVFPHEMWRPNETTPPRRLMDFLWERSALRYAANVKTPTMFVHGENDSNVPIAEAEQFYSALKDVGVETVMVRYPREGHSLRETRHVADLIDRSIAWYDRHFNGGRAAAGS